MTTQQTQTLPTEEFDKKFTSVLKEISQGPEIVNSFLLEDIVNLVYDYPTCMDNLLYRLNEFIDSSPPNFLLSSLYIIDVLIRYPTDEFCLQIEKLLSTKISEVIMRMCNSSPEMKDNVKILLSHWEKHNAFGNELIGKCKDIIRTSEFPADPNVVQIKTNVILLTQLPSDWNEYRIKEAANGVAQVLRVSLKPERHFAFIATPTRHDAEKLKIVLEKKMAEIKSNFIPKVVWGTEYWMKTFQFEEKEGIVFIPRDKIPPTVVLNDDGTYISERIPRVPVSRDTSVRQNRFSSTGAPRGGSARDRSSSRN